MLISRDRIARKAPILERAAAWAALFVLLLSGALLSDYQARAAATKFCSKPILPVVSPGNVRMRASPGTIASRGRVNLRLENRGTSTVTFGLSYRLARWRGGKWSSVPTGPFFAVRIRLASGSASECQAIDLSEHAPAGVYRVLKWVSFRQGNERRTKLLRAFFRVAEGQNGQK